MGDQQPKPTWRQWPFVAGAFVVMSPFLLPLALFGAVQRAWRWMRRKEARKPRPTIFDKILAAGAVFTLVLVMSVGLLVLWVIMLPWQILRRRPNAAVGVAVMLPVIAVQTFRETARRGWVKGVRSATVADDWRVTATLHEEGLVERLLDRLRRHEVGDDVVARLGGRVAVGTGPAHVFVYADSEGAAREAERILQDVCRTHSLEAAVTVDRWHPIEGRWEDATVPLPETDAQRQAEHERLQQDEADESQRTGLAEWEVRIELNSHNEAVELAETLAAEGMKPVRRWKYVVVGANNEDEARELAGRLQKDAPSGSRVSAEPGPEMIRDATAGTKFAAWFG